MRKILFFFLKISGGFHKLFLKIRGKTEEDVHDARIVSGKAWNEFCDNLKTAGNVLLSPGTPMDAFQQAEGVRFLSRLTRAGLEAFVEYNDPAFPELRRMVHETVKMGADNPDNYYLNAQISGLFEYRITGKRNTIDYVSFHTMNGNYGTTGGLEECGKIDDKDLVIHEDGAFEIILSKERKGENWLKLEDDTGMVMIRQTFADRSSEIPLEVEIKNTSGSEQPAPLTTRQVDEGLKTASMFVGGAPLLFTKWARGFQKHINQLPQFDPGTSNDAGGDDSIIYYHSYWRLENDEALVIEVVPPACDTWNFQLNNYWMESLDYRFFNICINKRSAVVQPDGLVRVIISKNDPGLPNWIETAGHNEGTMCWRWYRIHEGSSPVDPDCKVIKINEIDLL
ncbi:hypothetical protein ACFLQX_01805 [Bacteroidota bacterium]